MPSASTASARYVRIRLKLPEIGCRAG